MDVHLSGLCVKCKECGAERQPHPEDFFLGVAQLLQDCLLVRAHELLDGRLGGYHQVAARRHGRRHLLGQLRGDAGVHHAVQLACGGAVLLAQTCKDRHKGKGAVHGS